MGRSLTEKEIRAMIPAARARERKAARSEARARSARYNPLLTDIPRFESVDQRMELVTPSVAIGPIVGRAEWTIWLPRV